MGKALRTAGAIVGAVALVATGVGALALGGFAGTLTLGGVSVATLGQVGVGLSMAGSLVEGKPQVGGSAGTPTAFKADPSAGIPVAIDRVGTGGNIVLQATTGEKGKYLNFVTVHSLGPIEGYESFSANGEVVPFTTPGRNGEEAAGRYLNRMWRIARLGTASQTAMAWTATGSKDTPADHGGSVTGFWTADHRLRSLACTLWGLEFDASIYSTGVPKPLDVILGPAVYDPREDSTYPGGNPAGAQRIDNEDSWSFVGRDNPALQALTFAIGRRRNGILVAGIGLSPSAIDIAAHVEGANICDANGWKIAGIYYTTDPKYDVYRAMLMTGGGVPVPMGDRLSCMFNAPRVSLDTITADDLAGAFTLQGATSRRGRPNQVIPRVLSEAHGWEVVPVDPVTIADYVAADGRLVPRELEYQLCPSASQGAQLATYEAVNARELGPVVMKLKPRWGGYKSGDCITINDAKIGLVNQPMLIFRHEDDFESGAVTLTMRSETAAKHDFCLGRTANPPPVPGLAKDDPSLVSVPNIADWIASGATLSDNGQSIPAIVIEGEVADPNVAQLMVQYRPAGATAWAPAGREITSDARVRLEITGVTRDTTYNVQIAFRSHRGVAGAWISLDNVVAGDFSLDEITASFADGDITPGEKLYVVPWIKAVIARRAGLRERADALNLLTSNNIERLAYENAATALTSALAALTSPVAWDNSSDLTTVADPAGLRAALEAAQSTGDALQWQIDTAYGTYISDLDTKVDALFDAVGDGLLTTGEKLYVNPTISSLIFARAKLRDRANTMGLTVGAGNAERIAFENAASALDSMLATLTSPIPWNNTTDDTIIPNAASFRSALQNAMQTERDLQSVIDGQPTGGAFGTNITETAGGSVATNANYKTSLGTAYAFVGQTLWATYATWSPSQIASKTQYFDAGDGRAYDHRAFLYNMSVDGTAGRYVQPLSAGIGTISVAAHSVYVPRYSGIATLSIPATSFSGLSNDTNYTIFYRPDYGDWFPVVSSNAAPYKTSRDGYLEIGTISTPTSGGAWIAPTSDFETTGRYSAYDCVWIEARLASGQRAGSAQRHDPLTMMAPGGDIAMAGEINAIRLARTECVTLRTRNGGKLTVSLSAPIMTRAGPGYMPHAVPARDCQPGMAIPTLGDDEQVVWSMLESIDPAGIMDVAMISAGNGVYAAADPDSAVMVFTHNMYNKP